MNSAQAKFTIKLTHIDNIQVGDVVEIDGVLKTVGKKNLNRHNFYGTTLWGDSFKAGTVLVRKVLFPIFIR